MKSEYLEWIRRHVPDDPTGMCKEMTEAMVAAFPELRRVRGHYEPWRGGRFPHWWCLDVDGLVIDPTVIQFVHLGPASYVEHVGLEPVGKCLNCGDYVPAKSEGGIDCCSKACYDAFARSLM